MDPVFERDAFLYRKLKPQMLAVATHVLCLHLYNLYNLGSVPPNELAADSIDTWHRSANLTKPTKQAGASLVELGVPTANSRIGGCQ